MSMIEAVGLTKTYRVVQKKEGVRVRLQRSFSPRVPRGPRRR